MKGILIKWDQMHKGGDGRHYDFSSGQWRERSFAASLADGERRSFQECYRMADEIHPSHKATHIMMWQPGSELHGVMGEIESGTLRMVFDLLSQDSPPLKPRGKQA
jgi:hypothetical protein